MVLACFHVNDFFVMIAHGLLKKQAEKYFPDEKDIHNALLSGEGGMISAAPAHAVESLEATLRKDSQFICLFSAVLNGSSQQARARREDCQQSLRIRSDCRLY